MEFTCRILCIITIWNYVRICAGEDCDTTEQADVLVLLDGSGSITPNGFNQSLSFLKRFVTSFKLGPQATQIGLVVFSNDATIEFNLSKYNNIDDITRHLSNVGYPNQGTATDRALNLSCLVFANGIAGHRVNAMSIVLLITDGQSNNPEATKTEASKLKQQNVAVYAVGVGITKLEELQAIATNTTYVFQVESYVHMENIAGPLGKAICEEVNGCMPSTCLNGGTCYTGKLGYRCVCPSTYTGYTCEKNICEASNPCSQYGSCSISTSLDQWFCSCVPGFTGQNCTTNIDECSSAPCKYGRCIDNTNGYRCECYAGYTDTACASDINECSSNPCKNNGNCTNLINRFVCTCEAGFTGATCEIDINECASFPCKNGGTCKDLINAFLCECPERFYDTNCDIGICQPTIADIVFVVDTSASQSESDFKKQLEFIISFIDRTVIGEYDFQVALITFSFTAKIEFFLDQYKDNVTMKEAIRNVKYRPGATNTDKGLEAAMTVFNNVNTARGNNGTVAKRYVFVLTDGMSTNRWRTTEAAMQLKARVNKVVAIGIGNEVSHEELLTIASSGDHVSSQYVFSVNNFNGLYSIVSQLVHKTCDECYWNTSADIIFLMDMSTTMTSSDFQIALAAATNIISALLEYEVFNSSRVALVTFGEKLKAVRWLNDSMPLSRLRVSVQGLTLNQYCGVGQETCKYVEIADALHYVNQHVVDKSYVQSNSKRSFIVIFTNGHIQVSENESRDILKEMHSNNAVFSVAIGSNANITNIKKIVSDSAFVYFAENDNFKNLNALVSEFSFKSCNLTFDWLP